MFLKSRNWLAKHFSRSNQGASMATKPRFRPSLEILEDRRVPTANVWSALAGPPTNWNNPANWSLGHVPDSTEIATFDGTSQTFCLIDAPAAGTNSVSGIDI